MQNSRKNAFGDKDRRPSAGAAAFKTPLKIVLTRWVLFLSLLIISSLLGFFAYVVYRSTEKRSYEREYDSSTDSLNGWITKGFQNQYFVAAELASVYPFTVDNGYWPNITLPNFEESSNYGLNISSAVEILFAPLVTNQAQSPWEAYAVANVGLLAGGSALYETGPWSVSNGIFYYNNGKRKYDDVDDRNVLLPDVKFPIWQAIPATNNSNVMFNMYSDSVMADAIDLMITNNISVVSDFIIDTRFSEPVSKIFSPVFRDTDGQLVGCISTTFTWTNIFEYILPKNFDGLFLVLMSSKSTMSYTYKVKSNHIVYVGEGDRHRKEYSSKRVAIKPDSPISTLSDETAYTVEIYPSSTFKDEYFTDNALIASLTVALITFFVLLVFIAYDHYVTKREAYLSAMARSSSSIVNQLFPRFVRDRLFKRTQQKVMSPRKDPGDSFKGHMTKLAEKLSFEHTNPFSPRNRAGSTGSSANTGGNVNRREMMQDISGASFRSFYTNDGEEEEIIAESFESATVLFADIAGFTQWSSGRHPGEVFDLLETLFARFDKYARKLGVFKVETIGDCYMAVTGVPEVRSDHAETMAEFALCLVRGMDRVMKKKNALKSEMSELKIRVGFHSGPVIGGVVRGDKGRFQLFGDTVNTASRMESNGLPGKVHLSAATAELIKNSSQAYKYTLLERQDRIVAKGKGEMITFWLTRKPELQRQVGKLLFGRAFTSMESIDSPNISTKKSFLEMNGRKGSMNDDDEKQTKLEGKFEEEDEMKSPSLQLGSKLPAVDTETDPKDEQAELNLGEMSLFIDTHLANEEIGRPTLGSYHDGGHESETSSDEEEPSRLDPRRFDRRGNGPNNSHFINNLDYISSQTDDHPDGTYTLY